MVLTRPPPHAVELCLHRSVKGFGELPELLNGDRAEPKLTSRTPAAWVVSGLPCGVVSGLARDLAELLAVLGGHLSPLDVRM